MNVGGVDMARERKFTLEELYQVSKDTLIQEGYNGFTFSILAKKLNVSRGTIYKYFENKDELITEYMVHEMNKFIKELININQFTHFQEQFDFLFELIFKDRNIHQLIGMASQIENKNNTTVQKNIEILENLHMKMYTLLHDFIQQGKKEKLVKESLNNNLILGFIFQTIVIPNHFQIPDKEWIYSIKEMVQHGMLTK